MHLRQVYIGSSFPATSYYWVIGSTPFEFVCDHIDGAASCIPCTKAQLNSIQGMYSMATLHLYIMK